jgi:hypothetical protein
LAGDEHRHHGTNIANVAIDATAVMALILFKRDRVPTVTAHQVRGAGQNENTDGTAR